MQLWRKAFTMIELIFVIVIIGIIASVVIPKMDEKRAESVQQQSTQQNQEQSTWGNNER